MATWLVSFHGGTTATSINNLLAFPDSGNPYYALGPQQTPSLGVLPALDELRSFLLSPQDKKLYVVNAYKSFNQVLKFSTPAQAGDPYQFEEIYASDQLSHPFDITFAFNDNLFVSNQDTNAVTYYTGSGSKGTVFIGSGLKAVRGLAYDGKYLFVADAGNNLVSLYDSSGAPKGDFMVEQPVHLLYDGARYLYVGSEKGNSVWLYDTLQQISTNPWELISGGSPPLDATGGLALVNESSDSATLYVASRKGFQVLSYPLDTSKAPPAWNGTVSIFLHKHNLPDNPEFVGLID